MLGLCAALPGGREIVEERVPLPDPTPPHVTLNQIFAGMMPFMAIQVLAMFQLYMFPGIGLWLPSILYGH